MGDRAHPGLPVGCAHAAARDHYRARPSSYDNLPDGDALKLPFEDSRFDWVVSTLALCRTRDPVAILAEIARVLKPSGCYLFLEHGRSPDPSTIERQHRLRAYWGRLGGCELCLPIDETIKDAGLRIDVLERFQMGRPKFLSAMYRGSAYKAPS